MSRGAQLVWPVVALVMSFVAVFTLTRLIGSQRQGPGPTPPAGSRVVVMAQRMEITLEVQDQRTDPRQWESYQMLALLPNQIVVDPGRFCLAPTFAQAWVPEDRGAWQPVDGTYCHAWGPATLVLVRHR